MRISRLLQKQPARAGSRMTGSEPAAAMRSSAVGHDALVTDRSLPHVKSKRSRFTTLFQAATKSSTNFCCASELP